GWVFLIGLWWVNLPEMSLILEMAWNR
ncbi:MAG: hypothetical protein ACI9F9_001378, partial [Candidatus Paceibacteria bacterium]